MRAHQIMTRQVITIAADAPIVDAAIIMLRNHISGLPVVDQTGKLIGIISQGETADHPSDAQLVAYARKYFVTEDRLRP